MNGQIHSSTPFTIVAAQDSLELPTSMDRKPGTEDCPFTLIPVKSLDKRCSREWSSGNFVKGQPVESVPSESDPMLTSGSMDSLAEDRSVLDRRAEQLAQPVGEEPLASEFLELLTFVSGSDRLAIETRFVCEVLRNVAVTPLPGKNDPLVGITNLRGEVVAVMSLSSLLNATTDGQSLIDESGVCRWVIVIGLEHVQFGLAVSDVTEVVGIPNSEVLDPSRQTRISDCTLTRGVTSDARIILDGQAVLTDPGFVIEDQN